MKTGELDILLEGARLASEANKVVVQQREGVVNTQGGGTPAAVVDTTAANLTEVVDDNGSLNDDKNNNGGGDNPPTAENTPAPSKTLEELLAERTAGKFKSYDEIEAIINAPKQSEFANDYIKELNELAKSGVEFNNEFWELQSKDYKSITNPEVLLIEAMRLKKEYKGWSDEDLKLELDVKYGRENWNEEEADQTPTEKLSKRRFARDADMAKEELIERKDKITLKAKKQPTPAELESEKLRFNQMQRDWEQQVDNDILPNGSKIAVPIDEKTKDTFEFDVPESDKQKYGNILKAIKYKDVNEFWNQFKDTKGEIDFKRIYDALVFNEHKNDIVKLTAKNYIAKGRSLEVENLKNTNFNKDGTKQQTTPVKTKEEKNSEAIGNTLKAHGIKL